MILLSAYFKDRFKCWCSVREWENGRDQFQHCLYGVQIEGTKNY